MRKAVPSATLPEGSFLRAHDKTGTGAVQRAD
jgi:hypothetical protein